MTAFSAAKISGVCGLDGSPDAGGRHRFEGGEIEHRHIGTAQIDYAHPQDLAFAPGMSGITRRSRARVQATIPQALALARCIGFIGVESHAQRRRHNIPDDPVHGVVGRPVDERVALAKPRRRVHGHHHRPLKALGAVDRHDLDGVAYRRQRAPP